MFQRVGLNKAVSSEGFSVKIKDRFTLEYIENDGKIFEVYREPTEITGLCRDSIKNINNDQIVSEEHKRIIIKRISEAADFLGWKYEWY